MPDEKELAEGKPPAKEKEDDDEEGAGEKDVAELMDEDYDLGNEFKDQLIPLALEYYLEVIEEDDDDECDDDECDDDESDKPKKGGKKGKDSDGDDDEEDQKPAKGSKKGGKGGAGAGAGAGGQ